MTRNVKLAPGEFYHLYNRGTEKRNIFQLETDYERFLTLLYLCNGENVVQLKLQGRTLSEVDRTNDRNQLIHICSYCLMPNHFHLLVQEKEEGGISRFMQKVTTGYTMYFNERHGRSGGLFQGRFKATHANNDRYLKYLISYIHLNPVKLIEPKWKESGIENRARAEKFLRQYRHSSFLDYLGESRLEEMIISKNTLPEYFSDNNYEEYFKECVTEWLNYKTI